MWCDRCQSEVTPVSTVHGSLQRCSNCGVVLHAPLVDDSIRKAREILDRWKSSDILDQIHSTEALPPLVWASKTSRSDIDQPVRVDRHSESSTPEPDVHSPPDRIPHTGDGRSKTLIASLDNTSASAKDHVSPATPGGAESSQVPIAQDIETHSGQQHENWVARTSNGHLGPSPETVSDPHDGRQAKLDRKIQETSTSHGDHSNQIHGDEPAITRQSGGPIAEPIAALHRNHPLMPPPWLTTTVDVSATDDYEYEEGDVSPESNSVPPEKQASEVAEDSSCEETVVACERTDDRREPELDRSEHSVPAVEAEGVSGPTVLDNPDRTPTSQKSHFVRYDQAEKTTQTAEPDRSERSIKVSATAAQDESVVSGFITEESPFPAVIAAPESTKRIIKRPARQPQGKRPSVKRLPGQFVSSNKLSGPVNVSRKYRLDQPGGDAERSGSPVKPPYSFTEQPDGSERQETDETASPVSNSPTSASARRFRIDAAETPQDVLQTDGSRTRTHTRPKHRLIDEAHGSMPRGPHFQITSPKRSNLTSMTGQFLAYLGVLGLTIGTAMVIYGHFGGIAEYTPTGWLVTTVAQMLLFLGVINLVSGGIEQNNDDVSRRINHLGEQLLRIEQVTEEVLRGPKISPKRYMNPDESYEQTGNRATVDSE
ncbi:MAG: hypothetical protein KDA91_16985 [Planctomycetaceae bacterium]|nr:hypothetical protein [Planctomycetaceae bacterium]